MITDYDDFHIDKAPLCGICGVSMMNKMTKTTETTGSAIYAQTSDFDCVCATCWPHFVVASVACSQVFGSQVALGKRRQL